jgi:hypothetical protein
MRLVYTAIGAALLSGATPSLAHATIPAWARKYNANCSMCHSPAVPRLNAKGIQFKWAGYRLPEEIGEKAEVDKIQDYVAARTRMQYLYEKTAGDATAVNGFTLENVSLFVGGAVGKSFGGLIELERNDEGEVEPIVAIASAWGNESRYGGFRLGQGHMLVLGGGVAGFDRAIGIGTPTPLGGATTGVPLRLGGDLTGAEGYFVTGRNRFSVQVVNSVGGDEESRSTRKDLVLTNQFMWDDAGAGIAAAAYFGRIEGLDPDDAEKDSRYSRLVLSANKYFGDFEVLGGYVLSRDRSLPVGSLFERATNDGSAYWISGQYTIRPSKLTVFSRWELVDPNTDGDDDARRRFVLGSVLPVNLPEFMRLALEYRLDRPQGSGRSKTNGLAAEFMLTF